MESAQQASNLMDANGYRKPHQHGPSKGRGKGYGKGHHSKGWVTSENSQGTTRTEQFDVAERNTDNLALNDVSPQSDLRTIVNRDRAISNNQLALENIQAMTTTNQASEAGQFETSEHYLNDAASQDASRSDLRIIDRRDRALSNGQSSSQRTQEMSSTNQADQAGQLEQESTSQSDLRNFDRRDRANSNNQQSAERFDDMANMNHADQASRFETAERDADRATSQDGSWSDLRILDQRDRAEGMAESSQAHQAGSAEAAESNRNDVAFHQESQAERMREAGSEAANRENRVDWKLWNWAQQQE